MGIVLILRIGEKIRNRTGVNDRIAPTQIVADRPKIVARMPLITEPIGIVPQTRKRIVAFIRPCIRSGVIACRKLTWLML